jgi:hypothetical protein
VIGDRTAASDGAGLATALSTLPNATAFRGTVAEGADGESINRLAASSGSAPPQGLVLLAEANGEPVAAIGIFDGRTVTDPDRSTVALRTRLHLERLFVRAVVTVWGL